MAAPPTDNSNSNNNQDALSPTTEQLAVERHWYEGGEGHQVPIDRERLPLLGHTRREEALDKVVQWAGQKTRSGLYGLLTFIFVVLVVLTLGFYGDDLGYLPRNSHAAALKILSSRRIIDGHIDLPHLLRARYHNNVTAINLEKTTLGHVDIPRLKDGKSGGFFWSVFTPCPADPGADFTNPTDSVRDTLEQIEVAKLTIQKFHKTFQFARSHDNIRSALDYGKIASLLGVEGAHQLGNSLAVLRTYYELGVRYVTLTHSCHNAFADSASIVEALPPLHGGLSPLGRVLIREMNRLGMIVDLSHTADSTAIQAMKLTKAPVIWSHSSARAIHDVSRNVPDEILRLIGEEEGKTDGVVMVNFVPLFIAAPGNATVKVVADHLDHIAQVAGKRYVGIGSDFDGTNEVPKGLEDVSEYPNLFAELLRRGWTRRELEQLAGGNFLRILRGVEKASAELQDLPPAFEIYDRRKFEW